MAIGPVDCGQVPIIPSQHWFRYRHYCPPLPTEDPRVEMGSPICVDNQSLSTSSPQPDPEPLPLSSWT